MATKAARDSEEAVKVKIVDAYRRGVCDHNGGHIPKDQRGMAGKGSHFPPPVSSEFRENFAQIDWSR